MPSQRSRRARAPRGPSRSSHKMRRAQRRPSRSSAAMSGRPVVDPRTGRPGRGASLIPSAAALAVSILETYSGSTFWIPKHGGYPMARIAPLDPPYAADVAADLAAMMPPGVPPIGLFRTFARNLPMTRSMRPWGAHELGRSLALSLREREIVIDRTCARCGCEYEWGVHVAYFAERAGLSGPQGTSLPHGPPADACG